MKLYRGLGVPKWAEELMERMGRDGLTADYWGFLYEDGRFKFLEIAPVRCSGPPYFTEYVEFEEDEFDDLDDGAKSFVLRISLEIIRDLLLAIKGVPTSVWGFSKIRIDSPPRNGGGN